MQCVKFYNVVDPMSVGSLNSNCAVASNSSYRVSSNFTGYDKMIVKGFPPSQTSLGTLCTYNTDGTFTRSSLTNNTTITLAPSLNHRISFKYTFDVNLYSELCTSSGADKLYSNLNSISDTDIYNNINIMIPFFIILLIFSFSFMVLRKVIKSSSKGSVNI